jgi:hypothetical protein
MFQRPQTIESFLDVEKILTQWWQLFNELIPFKEILFGSETKDWGIPFKEILFGSETKDWGSLATDAMLAENVTVTGAALGDFALASMSVDIADLGLDAHVTAANTVTVTLTNVGAANPTDLGSGTLSVMVFKTHK